MAEEKTKEHKSGKKSESEIEKIENEIQHEVKEASSEVRKNPWMVATVLLAIVSLILLYFVFQSGGSLSGQEAGTKLVEYLNTKTGGGVEYNSSEEVSGLYLVNVMYKEEEIPVYTTKDGKYFIQSLIPMEESVSDTTDNTPIEVPKSDKPKVEAFVFSYCPYGLQFEKALLPVYKILKDKADIDIVFIGAMHGEYEKVESLRQLCVKKLYGNDKLWSYLEQFNADTKIGACGSDANCSVPFIDAIYTKAGIDKTRVNTCMKNDAEALYQADVDKANSLGISGSPTFVINDVETQSGRSPSEVQAVICSAFNSAPEECNQTLSNQQATAGFGTGTSASSSSAANCAV
ncbi:thioredoxin domain-containing protein [Candidatus Pacearchaeota archaeon]|nr:thioredoxin domain-containing protein [Candidatus Pacearchaeota archaeon]